VSFVRYNQIHAITKCVRIIRDGSIMAVVMTVVVKVVIGDTELLLKCSSEVCMFC